MWHVLSQCLSKEAANYLLLSIQHIQLSACIPDILYLQWDQTEHFLPLTWLATSGIDIKWSNRLSGGIKILPFYAELRARLSILCKTKYVKEASTIDSALSFPR